MLIRTQNLVLSLQSAEEVRAFVSQLPPEGRAQLSPLWLARVESSPAAHPWIHGFIIKLPAGDSVGRCGFKGPPDSEGAIEIAYGIDPEHQGQGYATEAAGALVQLALADAEVQRVLAHTLPETNASGRVLAKCGFEHVGEVIDPEDGLVWRWEKKRPSAH